MLRQQRHVQTRQRRADNGEFYPAVELRFASAPSFKEVAAIRYIHLCGSLHRIPPDGEAHLTAAEVVYLKVHPAPAFPVRNRHGHVIELLARQCEIGLSMLPRG